MFSAALAALATACGSSDDPTPGGSAGSPGAAGSASQAGSTSAGGSSSTTGDAAKGAVIWSNSQIACGSCHDETGKGFYGPNITSSKTAGIGNWTLAQFKAAVRDGKDTDGSDLCLSMSRYPASMIDDAGMADLFAYVQTKAAVDTPASGMLLCP